MSDLVNDVLNGLCCELCGVYFTEEHGHPVICEDCHDDLDEDIQDIYQLARHDTLG